MRNKSDLVVMEFMTIGQLKNALEGVPDERYIACQVVATDGWAWNMFGRFCPEVPHSNISCLEFFHPDLKECIKNDPKD